ncbi:vesicle transport protein SFT2A-like isoform X2 [Sparus aurata]|uniref:vesicle transport protein SFT2A-like isoform X2 n=1 Tax=Sparus aurata TaxID=8175 RepID=UPI0011C0DC55|nr:vesicle transport protein SFT2A-like isoform X2 [Sparus aurata]
MYEETGKFSSSLQKQKQIPSPAQTSYPGSLAMSSTQATSTLGLGKAMHGFITCSMGGFVCLILGGCMLCVPLIGLTLFTVFYTIGNICAFCSTMFLMEPLKQLAMMFDKTRALTTSVMIACLVLTLCAAIWVKSAELALFFCILQVLSFIWEAIMKMSEICSRILSACIWFLMGLVHQIQWLYENSP